MACVNFAFSLRNVARQGDCHRVMSHRQCPPQTRFALHTTAKRRLGSIPLSDLTSSGDLLCTPTQTRGMMAGLFRQFRRKAPRLNRLAPHPKGEVKGSPEDVPAACVPPIKSIEAVGSMQECEFRAVDDPRDQVTKTGPETRSCRNGFGNAPRVKEDWRPVEGNLLSDFPRCQDRASLGGAHI